MELWIRYRQANHLEYDECFHPNSQSEWLSLISRPEVISSILWPTVPRFQMNGHNYRFRVHHHEINYQNDVDRNKSYMYACKQIAIRLEHEFGGSKILVYAPLRGALPIWRAIEQYLTSIKHEVYFPVTSSFVKYPTEFKILNWKGKSASGRFTNILELERLHPFLHNFDFFLYVDEIVSGGMTRGHLKEMFKLKINKDIKIITVGLADKMGERSVKNRNWIQQQVENKLLSSFIWEGCNELITEDQRYLIGMHYINNNLGPNAVPMLDENLEFYKEKNNLIIWFFHLNNQK